MTIQKSLAAAMGRAALAGARARQEEELEAQRPQVDAVVLPNGLRLQYVEQGDPEGPAVLLLHGYTDSWRSWERLLPVLPPHWRVLALTQRGHGDADRPRDYAVHDMADDAAAFLDAVGVKEALVVGHSMGATVAECLAIRHPGRVAGLALLGAFATFAGNAEIQALWAEDVVELSDPIDPAFVRAFQQGTLARPVPAPFFEAMVAESLKLPARVWRGALAGQIRCELAPKRARITCATLLIWGECDALVPRSDQETLLAEIRDARLQVLPGSGHAPHWEVPAAVAALLARFVTSAAAAARRGQMRN